MNNKIIISGTLMIAVTYGLARFAFGLLLPNISNDLKLGSGTMGMISSATYIAYCLAIAISTYYSNQKDPKMFVSLAGLTSILGIFIISVSHEAVLLFLGVFIAGMSTGFGSPAYGEVVQNNLDKNTQNKANTWINAGTGFGIVISGPIAYILSDNWRVVYLIFGIIAIIVLLINYLYIPKHISSIKKFKTQTQPYSLKPLLQKSMSINIASLILGCASAIYWTFSKDYIATVPSNSDFITSSFWILVGVSGIIGGFSGGLISKFSIKTLYIIVVLMMATSILSLNIDNTNLFIIFLSALFFGSSYVFLTGILMIWGIKIFEKVPSLGIGVPFFTLAFGQIIGAMVSGNVIQFSSYTLAFSIFGAFSLVSIVFRPKI